MRAFNSVVILMLMACVPSVAQQFSAGVLAGVSATQISGDQLSGFNKAGIVAGGFVSTTLSPKFDLALGITYFQKGSKKNTDPDKEDYTYYRLRLNYFDMPLLLQWKYNKKLIFEAGPSVAVLLSEEEEDEFGVLSNRRPFEKIEFAANLGMNVTVVKQLSFLLRMGTSMLPVRKHQSGESYRFNKGQFNSTLLFGLQYKFGNREKPVE